MTASGGRAPHSPLERFEVRAQHAFDWISAHPRQVLAALGGALLAGLVVAGLYEWTTRAEDAAQEALGRVERSFAEAFGGDRRLAILSEPANLEQARRAREVALAGFEGVEKDHPRSRAAEFARLRAAELEADLGQHDAALQRLTDLEESLDRDDPLRGVVLRLEAYVQYGRGEYLAAAEAYERGAETEAYPDTPMLWLGAAQTYERAGAPDRAILAYQQVLSGDPALAEQEAVLGRLLTLQRPGGGGDPAPPAGGRRRGLPGLSSDKMHSVK
jgi:tetratricopeptide (TPR) repeat protein